MATQRSPLRTACWLLPALLLCWLSWRLYGKVNVEFESSTGEWGDVTVPFKGRTYDVVSHHFARFQVECRRPDAKLVRVTEFPVLRVPAWASYWLDPEWRLPYQPPRMKDHGGFIHCGPDAPPAQPRQ